MRKLLLLIVFLLYGYSDVDIMNHPELKNLDYVDSVMKVYSQTIVWQHPKWKGVHRQQSKDAFIMEFIPNNQELKTWSDMLTIQGFKGLAEKKDITPQDIELLLANNIKNISSSELIFQELSNISINGYEGVLFLLGLKKLPYEIIVELPEGVSEVSLYLVVKGKSDFYVMHRSWKREAIVNNKLPFADLELQEWVNVFKNVKIY